MKSSEVIDTAEAEIVKVKAEVEASAKSWLGKARAWFLGSTWKGKAGAVVGAVFLGVVGVHYLSAGISHVVGSAPKVEHVAKAPAINLAAVQKDASDAKDAVESLTKTVNASQAQIDEIKKRVDALDDGVRGIIAEMRELEERVAVLPAPKAVTTKGKPSKPATTGSVKPKAKAFDWSDPSTWSTP